MTTLTYRDYLRIDNLLSIQVPRTPDTARTEVVLAEHFFIVAHQTCELWLKQIIADLGAAAEALSPEPAPGEGGLETGDAELSAEFLERASDLLFVLHAQLVALEKLPLRLFAEFRPYLDTASGAESAQFKALSQLLGNDIDPGRLYEAFRTATESAGTSVAEVCRLGSRAGVFHRIAELLLDIGNGYWRWKVAHLGLMSRSLGQQAGTGGSSGAMYLAGRLTMPFGELRRLRGEVHDEFAANFQAQNAA
ncbi:tryptophan 2,3-dioxygenase family protein [Streptomyces sp. CA-250714]|uniref:tryptophan 2,3-dioxygenase family protein n=1 Tax=Streptomyces sp. CA-250714 TaxID=3240060 RepID=UPI003D8CE1CB